tara:strand:- start:568 stop:1377 length:810 start_codon:yes stop_codon:yes gene_type:complete
MTSTPSRDTYYVNDHLATTVAVADAAGMISQIEADAFGTPMGDPAANARYTSKPYDEDLGAYVFPFRNYRSEEGRWMSGDPSGFPDGANSRKYLSAPTLYMDPSGLVVYEGTELNSERSFASGSVWALTTFSVAESIATGGATAVYGISWEWTRSASGSYSPGEGEENVSFSGTLASAGSLSGQNGNYLYAYPTTNTTALPTPSTWQDAMAEVFSFAIDTNPMADLYFLSLANDTDFNLISSRIQNSLPSGAATSYSWKNVSFRAPHVE